MRNYILFLVFLSVLSTSAQEANYWFNNFGAISTLKGGVEVAGTRSISAIYYNPGALAFIDGEFLEGQADLLALEIYNLKNVTGDGINLNFAPLDVTPSIVGYYKKLRSNPKWSYALGLFTRFQSSISFSSLYEAEGAYLLPQNEVDLFQGQLNYDNRIKENWLNGSVAYVVNENIGLGLAINAVVRTQDYQSIYDAIAFPKNEVNNPNQSFSKFASTIDDERFRYRALGFVLKPGVNFDFDKLKLGLTLTTPFLNIGLLNNQANRSFTSVLPDEDVQFIRESNSYELYRAVYKTPFAINIGAEYTINRIELAASIEWFSQVKPYEMIKKGSNGSEFEFPAASNPKFAIPMMANKSILNAGFSFSYSFSEKIKYLGSFRTDFNTFDDKALDRNVDFVPNITFWDIYHVTSGILITRPRANLSFGFDYGHGSAKNNSQFVNMTNASQSNLFLGELNNSASAVYNNISFTLGLNFNIDTKKGLRTEKI